MFMLIVLAILGYALQRIGKASELMDQPRVSAHFCSQCGLPVDADRDHCRTCGTAIHPRFHTL